MRRAARAMAYVVPGAKLFCRPVRLRTITMQGSADAAARGARGARVPHRSRTRTPVVPTAASPPVYCGSLRVPSCMSLRFAHSLEQGLSVPQKHVPEMIVSGPKWLLPLRQFLDEAGMRARIVVFGAQRHRDANAEGTAAAACGYVSYLTPSRIYLPWVALIADGAQPGTHAGPALCRRCAARPTFNPPKLQLTHRERQVFVANGKASARSISPRSWASA